MGTHNICFHGEIRKIFCEHPLLPGAMLLFTHSLYNWPPTFFCYLACFRKYKNLFEQVHVNEKLLVLIS